MKTNLEEIIRSLEEEYLDVNTGEVIKQLSMEERVAELELKVSQILVILQHITDKK